VRGESWPNACAIILACDGSAARCGRRLPQRIEKLTSELYAAINEEWRRGWTYNVLIDDAFKIYLLRSTAVWTEHLAMQVRTRKGKLDPDRDRLYQSLLDIGSINLAASSRHRPAAPAAPVCASCELRWPWYCHPMKCRASLPFVGSCVHWDAAERLDSFATTVSSARSAHGAGRDQSSRKNNC
jgi:hypothetical protein